MQLPLLVHIIFHPASDAARALARTIHDALNADAAVPGLRVPTVFCPSDGVLPPADYDALDDAERSFVIVLADACVVDRDRDLERHWSTFIGDLWESCRGSVHRFFPVQLDEYGWGFDPRLEAINFLRAHSAGDAQQRDDFVVRRVIVELCRQLGGAADDSVAAIPAPVRLFLSHTKLDIDQEPNVVRALMAYLTHDQPVRAWVDSGDIDTGSPFAEAIENGIQDTSLLCVLTDHYSTRAWCRREIILAKQHQRPVVVVAAFQRQEVRSFPYLGNVPVLRWPCIPPTATDAEKAAANRRAAEAAVDLLLKETLRHLHTTVLLNQVKRPDDFVLARPPELLSLLSAKDSRAVLYPDPPLGSEELALLSAVDVPAETPLSRLAAARPLKGARIALSLSESTDLPRLGLDAPHLREAMLEIARYLLVKGATLVYGGHLGTESYTAALFELVRAHHDLEGVDPVERIVNTVGWPLPYDQPLLAKYSRVARLIRVGRPRDLDDCPGKDVAGAVEADPFTKAETAESRYCWGRGMTQMREAQMAPKQGIAARIVLGGKFGPPASGPGADEPWYKGRVPGVLEEVALAAKARQPVFLIGAFGGAAALAIDLLEGRDRPEATWDYQRRAPHAVAMRALYDRCAQPWWDYPDMVQLLRDTGPAGINPLLTPDENRELFYTRSIQRMLELILIGLGGLAQRP